ncbi:pyrimidine reductase [Kribbella antibiotica]|uniref:Pyrimidine reductase n=1 Tax=Kribbella antibiotica TaxID=190195 RepID=A0A4R4YLI9_9ACTN|nr:dihydrofolate reductase family protein [Kribbella antibiotica]TDD45843.1 pyrimidine reductase [Kribbella antibiotica]
MRPHVVAQVAVSLDGRTAGFDADLARYYAMATLWQEDVTLAGADTILAQESAVRGAREGERRAEGPLLAVVDSRARVREWDALRALGYWSDVLALYADQTPARPADATTRELVTGYEQVDLEEVLVRLGEGGARVVRVESGGALIAVLLELGLVDELALLVHPVIVGSGAPWCGTTGVRLEHAGTEVFAGGVVWSRYCVS